MAEHPDFKLGRRPTPDHVLRRSFKLQRYLRIIPPSPSTLDLTGGISSWPMFLNDQLGDCTCAAVGHEVEVFTDQVDGQPTLVTDADVLALYETQGYVPGDPSTDQGANMESVLKVWRKQGIASHTILGYANVAVTDHALLQAGCYLFSGLYIGINMPITAQAQTDAGQPWDWVANGGPDGEPGSWGGHAVNVVRYAVNRAGRLAVTVVSWGKLIEVTPAFWEKYVEEAWCVIPQDYDRLQGKPLRNGFNETQLLADLSQLDNPPFPNPIPSPPPSPGPSPNPSPDPGPTPAPPSDLVQKIEALLQEVLDLIKQAFGK